MKVTKASQVSLVLLIGSIIPLKQLILMLSFLLVAIPRKIEKDEVRSLLIVIILTIIPIVISIFNTPLNQFLSVALMFPFIFIIVFRRSFVDSLQKANISDALNAFVYLLLANGFIGSAQYLIHQNDDAAIGFYGSSGLGIHGLAALYFMAAVYLWSKKFSLFNFIKIALLIFFMILCFYGAGMLAAAAAIVISSFISSNKKIQSLLVAIIGIVIVGYLGWVISPSTMNYNYNILLLFIGGIIDIINGVRVDVFGMPRKLLSWILYFEALYQEPYRIFTGYGGGAFNSRAAFLLNGDYSSMGFLPVSTSFIHETLIMPLWSSFILSQNHSDGTMNQPFSSILAILSEYSLLGLVIAMAGFNRLRQLLIFCQCQRVVILINTIFIYFAILCLFDNMIEYPEIFIPFVFFAIGIVKNKKVIDLA